MLVFNEERHTYTHTEKKILYKGATTFLKNVEHPYNTDFWTSYKAVQLHLLTKGEDPAKWWLLKDILTEEFNKGLSFSGTDREINDECERLRTEAITKFIRSHPSRYKFLKTKETFKSTWKDTSDESCVKGTKFHKIKEDKLLDDLSECVSSRNDLDDLIEKSVQIDQAFQHPITTDGDKLSTNIKSIEFGKWYPELILYNDDLELCGTADAVMLERRDNRIIINIDDWKTNKKIDVRNNFGTRFFNPVSHLDECNYNKYRLQISLYYVLIAMQFGMEKCIPGQIGFTHCDTFGKELPFRFPPLVKEILSIIKMYGNN